MSYKKLCTIHQELSLLNTIKDTLAWDQETYLPSGSVEYRSKQLSYLSAKSHQLLTSQTYQNSLKATEQEDLNYTAQANVREWRYHFDRISKLPESLVTKSTEIHSQAIPIWQEAREKNDFNLFAPTLKKLINIAKEKAELWGYQDEIYSALLSNYERGTTTTDVASIFEKFSPNLIKLAGQATKKSLANPPRELQGHFPVERQQKFNTLVAKSIGFDFNKGRIDTTTHPFCSGIAPHDVRLTTRYYEGNFLPSLFGVMHEAGHGMYEQGLPCEEFGRPAGTAVSLGIHESQSLLWENHIGRSKEFWSHWLPKAKEFFPQLNDWSVNEIHHHINTAKYSFIRVDADEATYDLHILLRFKIERMIINEEIEVKDIPSAWNELSKLYFGKSPTSNTQGCLQDIHWSFGLFGYFATYSLGNFNASQLFHKVSQDKHIHSSLLQANYTPLLSWLQENIHKSASSLLPQELMKKATGEITNPQYHLNHLKQRFVG